MRNTAVLLSQTGDTTAVLPAMEYSSLGSFHRDKESEE